MTLTGEELPFGITPREMEILRRLTCGESNKQIAYHLQVAYQTVANHVTGLMRKTGMQSRTQLAALALRRGWVTLDEACPNPEGNQDATWQEIW